MPVLYAWTEDKLDILFSHLHLLQHEKITYPELAAKIGYPEWCVRKKANKYGIHPGTHRWSPCEIIYMKEFGGKIPGAVIARQLGIDDQCMRRKLRQMGLNWEQEKLTHKQKLYVLKHYKVMGNNEMADNINKSMDGDNITGENVRKYLRAMGKSRSKNELDAIIERNINRGIYQDALIKAWQTRKARKPGDRFIRAGIEWVALGGKKIMMATKYTWLQAGRKLPKNKRVVKIDPSKPITIDNLKLEDKNKPCMELSDAWVLGILAPGNDELKKHILEEYPYFIEAKKEQLKEQRKLNKKKHAKRTNK